MCKIVYTPNPAHRNSNPVKSQWTISIPDEKDCFYKTINNNWIDLNSKYAWGLKYSNNNNQYFLDKIGITPNREITKIARFEHTDVFKDGHIEWHGYPVDYKTRKCDIPSTNVLQMWVKASLINKSKMSHIQRQISCSL